MRRFFSLYQIVAPLALTPLAYGLWWRFWGGDHRLAIFSLALPVISSYVVPGIGCNVLKLWEFHTRLRVGRFRPHHGFMFGSAAAVFAWLCFYPAPASDGPLLHILKTAFILGSATAFWNWLYDLYAIRAGFITVYNQVWARGGTADEITTDYAPIYFGVLGAAYGAALRLAEYVIVHRGRPDLYPAILAAGVVLVLVLPVGAYVISQYLRTGQAGIRPCQRRPEAP